MAIILKLFLFVFNKTFSSYKALAILLVTFIAIYNAYFLSLTLPLNQTSFSIITIIFFFFSFSLFFFPSIKKLERVIYKHYPINSFKRYFTNLVYSSIYTREFLFTLFFITFFSLFTHLKHYSFIVTFFVFIFISYILRRCLQVLVFNYFKFYH